MRAIFSKVVTGSMIAGAALLVSACGDSTPADTSVDNTMVTDMNSMEPMDGTMTDNMTSVDGAMANDTMMSNDTMMANDTMMSNDTMTNAM
jgi:hypothetical protein